MHSLAEELGADFRENPLWWLNKVITVHALGGCPMGRDEREGVVDSYGRVFNYPGLHIADGSVMPGPVGPNPSLTIAALADRFADAIVEGREVV
jgi:cholesterol oxidase